MPELPDVETMRRYLSAEALGRTVERVVVADRYVLRGLAPAALADALEGRELTATARHGKWLFARIADAPWLVLHFGMTGGLRVTGAGEEGPSFTRVSLRFDDGGALHFRDQRKFGRVALASDTGDVAREHRLGPDALDPALTLGAFGERLERRRGPLKGLLLDQSFVAGVGNIYGDEICHEAGIAPLSRVEHFDDVARRRTYRAMRSVLGTAVELMTEGARFPTGWLIGRRRADGVCPRCGRPVSRVRFQGRYTYWCPCSQREL